MGPQPSVDEDLAEGLRGAKKSPRNFALICKGPKPVKLIVQKKPVRAGELTKAKTESKGTEVIVGTVEGDGADHVFSVVGEVPNVKTSALKEFISEQAGLTCKPRFQSVKQLVSVGDDEPETGASQSNETSSSTATTTENNSASEQETNESEAEESNDLAEARQKLLDALKGLMPTLQKVIGEQPGRRIALLTDVDQIKKQVATDLAAAQQAFDTLVASLGESNSGNKESAEGSKVSLVKLGIARVEWRTTRDTAGADLRKLKAAIAEEFGDDSEQAGALTAAMKTLDNLTAEVENNLHEQLDAILNAEAQARGPLVKAAKATISKLTTLLDNDEVMVEIDDNEFLPGMLVVAPLKKKLQEISAAIG